MINVGRAIQYKFKKDNYDDDDDDDDDYHV